MQVKRNSRAELRLKVTVCVSTYNQDSVIASCLESIVSQEADFPIEILVSDDCSSDMTVSIIRDFEARYPNLIRAIYQSVNQGSGHNYMALHSVARGEYVAHIDGDDMMLPGKIKTQVEFLDANPDYVAVWHQTEKLDEFGVRSPVQSEGDNFNRSFQLNDLLCYGSVAVHSSKMYRADVFEKVLYGIKHRYDYEIDLLQLQHGLGHVLTDCLGVYRFGHESLTNGSGSRFEVVRVEMLKDYVRAGGRSARYAAAHILFIALVDLKRFNLRCFRLLWFFLFNAPLWSSAVFLSTLGRRWRIIRFNAR